MSRLQRSSTNSEKHPYLRTSHWINPASHFWENGNYTEKAKDYF